MSKSQSPAIQSAAEIEQIISWAREAGKIAMGYFNNITPQRKPDHTFVTQADLEIERFLSEHIQSAYPDHNLIGEEGAQNRSSTQSPYVWTLDPIDGTTVFVQGLPGWGISIGLLSQGRPHFGLFYMPLIDDLTYTDHQGGVCWNGRPLQNTLRKNWRDKGFLALSSTAHADYHINIRRSRALGSIGAKLAYTARGTAVATFVPRSSLWDIAGGAAILNRLGGELRYLSGKPIDYLALLDGSRTPEPLLAGRPDLLDELQRAIRLR